MSVSDVTILLVTYNSESIISESLSLLPEGYPVIIVDNASEDSTCALIESFVGSGVRDDIVLVRNHENLGYGSANNVGLRLCRTRYVLVLNPDAFISGESIEVLCASLETDDRAVVAGPLIEGVKRFKLYPLFHRSNPLFRPFLKIYPRSRRIRDFSRAYECGFIVGAVMLYDLRKMPSVVYFDEDIFLYYEESEWQSRIIGLGYKVLLETRARARHYGGASVRYADARQRDLFRYYHMSYSRGVLAAKYPDRISSFDLALFIWSCRLKYCFFYAFEGLRLKYRSRLRGIYAGLRYRESRDNESRRGVSA